jgi:hypothetical protein
MPGQMINAGENSISSKFMDMVSIHHAMNLPDFEKIVAFLVDHMDDVISDVHKLNKLSLDDGFVSD